ncbi:MAG: methionine--tRNA ligase, partial [Candidatus Izimaplasma sp.]|nr:methionine--tRNA ligase [Candidatus Izimaplasma bacterium]
ILLKATKELFAQLNISKQDQTWASLAFGRLEKIHVTDHPVPIFPRLEQKEEEAYIKDMINPPKQSPKQPKIKDDNFATIEDFTKLEIVVGEVISSKAHPNADRLLVSKIDTGDRVRQIVSGIKPHYSPEDFVGKKVIVIKNLKPVELRGELSEGMILAGKNKKILEVLQVDKLNKGDIIS